MPGSELFVDDQALPVTLSDLPRVSPRRALVTRG
jgi:hypothetical protein